MTKFILILCTFIFLSPKYSAASALDDAPLASKISSQAELNDFVASRAHALYAEMNSSDRFSFFAYGEKFSTPSKCWISKGTPLVDDPMDIIFKTAEGVKASLAIKDFFTKGGVIDCCVAYLLVVYKIFCELLGDPIFDEIYKKGIYSLHINERITRIGTPSCAGQFGHFPNADDYPKLHPTGSSRGENVFCIGDDSYLGFGPPI